MEQELLAKIEKRLLLVLSDYATLSPKSAEMARYHLNTGGKRIRALIPALLFQKMGVSLSIGIDIGVVIELIHNATLVHDDLQDGDEIRRNHPTVWKKFSPEQAINCGDFLFHLAQALALKLDLPRDEKLKFLEHLNRCTILVIEGQAQEFVMKKLLLENRDTLSFEKYLAMVEGKTSGLFSLPIVGSLLASGQGEAELALGRKLSLDLGIWFQLRDDYIDLYGDKGRGRAGCDLAEGKMSALVVLALESAEKKQKEFLQRTLLLPRHEKTEADLSKVLELIETLGAKTRCEKLLIEYEARFREQSRGTVFEPVLNVVIC